jgi:hypothetical protein
MPRHIRSTLYTCIACRWAVVLSIPSQLLLTMVQIRLYSGLSQPLLFVGQAEYSEVSFGKHAADDVSFFLAGLAETAQMRILPLGHLVAYGRH